MTRQNIHLSRKRALRLAMAACLLAASGSVLAAGMSESPKQPSIKSVSPAEIQAAALSVQHQNGIAYVSGGIGVAERAWLAAHAKDYNTRLSFAQVPGGAYLSGVAVTINKAGGKEVMAVSTDGPMLYLQLPAGRYQLVAKSGGRAVKRMLAVPKQGGRKWVIGFRKPKG